MATHLPLVSRDIHRGRLIAHHQVARLPGQRLRTVHRHLVHYVGGRRAEGGDAFSGTAIPHLMMAKAAGKAAEEAAADAAVEAAAKTAEKQYREEGQAR